MQHPKLLFLPVLILGVVGCAKSPMAPSLGKWDGKFEVQSVKGNTDVVLRERSSLHGYLMLYLTEHRFIIHLEAEQEIADITGSWKGNTGRVVLTPRQVNIDDNGGEEKRDPNKTWIAPDEIRKAYSAPLSLHFGPTGKTLQGPPMQIGTLLGHHEFTKAPVAH